MEQVPESVHIYMSNAYFVAVITEITSVPLLSSLNASSDNFIRIKNLYVNIHIYIYTHIYTYTYITYIYMYICIHKQNQQSQRATVVVGCGVIAFIFTVRLLQFHIAHI